MGIRVTGDKRECRVLVKDCFEQSKAREELEKICSDEEIVVMPDDILRSNLGYEMVFRNRHTLKEFLCFEGFGKEDFQRLMSSLKKVFSVAERNKIDPYSFVFDISCIFTENSGKRFLFVYTPECVTEKNNGCADLVSLVSLYSGAETDSPDEIMMRNAMEILREWESDRFENGNIRYDFPELSGVSEKKTDRACKIICIRKEKPFITVFRPHPEEGDEGKVICKIGRDGEWADVQTESAFSSRRHAEIIYENGDFFYFDMTSENGSILNGKNVASGEKRKMKKINRVDISKEKKIIFLCLTN